MRPFTNRTQISKSKVAQFGARATVLVVVLLGLAPAAAFADPPPALAPATRSAKVSLAGLDLSTPAGARAAEGRLRIVAQHLCFQLSDPRKIDFRAAYEFCVAETLADAVRRLNAPALAALKK